MKLEYCDICEEPTGGAGRSEDSIVCAECDKVICENCQDASFENVVLCKECTLQLQKTHMNKMVDRIFKREE